MSNYAEEIIYWYYRLNYFFLLTNFVMHQAIKSHRGRSSTEVDILGVKPKYAIESIPTYPNYILEPDPELLRLLRLNHEEYDRSFIYVMVEVTSGESGQDNKFESSRVEYNLKRFGLHCITEASKIQDEPIIRLAKNVILCKIFSNICRPVLCKK